MKSTHEMPFGARLDDNGVAFGLWAPSAERVELMLGDGKPKPMAREPDGWFRIAQPQLDAGARYSFQIDGKAAIPDPCSRFQPDGPLKPSAVIDPRSYDWKDGAWSGRPWREAIIWEAHVGAATQAGAYAALAEKLPELAALGVTALELMPLADCPGSRNWGYDGVLAFAPNHSYGDPSDLKSLVDRAHALGMMVFLDVVYNHFGPCGNFMPLLADAFFNRDAVTPWGAAINFDGERSDVVRAFFIHNALYWLEEFHFDGLRFDAVHAFVDAGDPPFLTELAQRIRESLPSRKIHLILENDKNEARWLARDAKGAARFYDAQWDDDVHHCWHRLLTHEDEGYYVDFDNPAARLGRGLAEGFVYQGEASKHAGGRLRGEKAGDLPPYAFVAFLQNHDQIGNRAYGERIAALADPDRLSLATAVLLLSPQIPMLFMGEEWDASSPFLYFVDFPDDPALAKAVRDGRQKEFSRFAAFSDPGKAERIPDPTAPATFQKSKLDWAERERPPHSARLSFVRDLLRIRRESILPVLASRFRSASRQLSDREILDVSWNFERAAIRICLNFGSGDEGIDRRNGDRPIWTSPSARLEGDQAILPAWTGICLIGAADGQ